MRSAALLTQALQLHQQGQLQKARALYERVLKAEPKSVQALHLLGVLAAQTGHYQWSVDLIGRAIALVPGEATFHNDRGNALVELGRTEDAIASFERAIALRPDYAEAYYNRGDALQNLRRLDDALASYDAAIAAAPDFFEAHNNRGNVLRELERHEEAAASYRHALTLQPADVDAQLNLARALRAMHRLEEAGAAYQRTLELRPDLVDAMSDMGGVLRDLGHTDRALDVLNHALQLAPDHAPARVNRGAVLIDLGHPEEALRDCDHALSIEPRNAQAHGNRGNALRSLDRFAEAIESYDRAIALAPDFHDPYGNKAATLLADERFREGWPLYERGWDSGGRGKKMRLAPDWDGATRTRSLLVLSEQGVGDQILYSSMLPDARALADELTVVVDPRMVPLFARSFAADGIRVLGRDDPLPAADRQIYLGSLGQHFRLEATHFQRARNPYLGASRERRDALRAALGEPERLICGLSWSSKAARTGSLKSLALEALAPLLSLPGATFVNLQYGDTREERARLEASSGLRLVDVPSIDNFNDLDGLAALIDACDVVITVSNTTAHLAGALGKHVFVLLSDSPGLFWYWHRRRDDSLWYPSARLVRQSQRGRWDDAVAAVTGHVHAMQRNGA